MLPISSSAGNKPRIYNLCFFPGVPQSIQQREKPMKKCRRRIGRHRKSSKTTNNNQISTEPNLTVNISSKNLTDHLLSLLNKDLSFCPTTQMDFYKVEVEMERFFRNLRLNVEMEDNPPSQALQPPTRQHNMS